MSDKLMKKNVIKIVEMEKAVSDFAFWQTRPFEERLRTLETIRNEYMAWAYDTKPGFQRVYRIVKQK